jgi:hypothetical protein
MAGLPIRLGFPALAQSNPALEFNGNQLILKIFENYYFIGLAYSLLVFHRGLTHRNRVSLQKLVMNLKVTSRNPVSPQLCVSPVTVSREDCSQACEIPLARSELEPGKWLPLPFASVHVSLIRSSSSIESRKNERDRPPD